MLVFISSCGMNKYFHGIELFFEADLTGANILNANFEGANLNNAIWVDGKKCKLRSIGECMK